MAYRRGSFALTAPSMPLFGVAVVLAVLAAVSHWGGVSIPVVSANELVVMTLAFVVLAVGVVLRGA